MVVRDCYGFKSLHAQPENLDNNPCSPVGHWSRLLDSPQKRWSQNLIKVNLLGPLVPVVFLTQTHVLSVFEDKFLSKFLNTYTKLCTVTHECMH